MAEQSVFGTDGVRGRANRYPITPEFALQLGKAIGAVFESAGHDSRRCVIGKDTRLSGYMLETALTSGMVSMGMDVYLVGPLPTPAVAHLTRTMTADVGLMITASHNPAEDNGIKIFNTDGFKLNDAYQQRIEELVMRGDIASDHVSHERIGKAHRLDDARGRYIEFAKSSAGQMDLRGMRIAVDGANGAGYFIGPLILEELGAEVMEMGTEPDGFNINLNCGALHPQALGERVRETRADIGIAFDGDADRVVFLDERGEMIDGNQILGICALDLKRRGQLREDTMVTTVMANLGMVNALKRQGIETIATKVGDRHVIDKLQERRLAFGGEESGHIIFLDYSTTGDGIISALQMLRIMQETGKTLRELADGLQLYPSRLHNLPVSEKRELGAMPTLQQALQECDASLNGEGRHLVRYSGTENLLRILVEAPDGGVVEDWIRRIAGAVEADLQS